MSSANYMGIIPAYTVSGERAEIGPGGTGIFPTNSSLTNVQGDEVETVVGIMRRMGFDTISVSRQHPISFVSESFPDEEEPPPKLYGGNA